MEEYQRDKSEYASVLKKISDLELSVAENKSAYYSRFNCRDVIETLTGMEASRRCYRVVDSILVERNVGEVKEALEVEKNNVSFKMCLDVDDGFDGTVEYSQSRA